MFELLPLFKNKPQVENNEKVRALQDNEPADASMIVIAPSSTRNAFSTSKVKSTWPGVSIRLSWCRIQGNVIDAEAIVIPKRKKKSGVLPRNIECPSDLWLALGPYSPSQYHPYGLLQANE